MEDLDLEIILPSEGQRENITPSGPLLRPLLDPERLRAQNFQETPGSGKVSLNKERLIQEINEEMKQTSGSKKTSDQPLPEYCVMLNLTDVSYGVKGHNKYYKIQVLKSGKGYSLYTQWGRVGAKNPQSNYEDFDSKIEAVKAFKKKFRSKTMNSWDDRENFEPQVGKYVMIDMAEDAMRTKESINQEIQKLNNRNQELKLRIESKESKLDPRIFSLMKLIWDINRMNRTLRELNFDTEKYPLGKLTADQIQKGYRILTEIQTVLMQDGRKDKLIQLTNEFYTNIPQNFGMRLPPRIDNIQSLKDKVMLLDVLRELDVANKYINLALFHKANENINPLDSFFEILNIKMRRMNDSNLLFTTIQNSLRTTHGPTHDQYSLSLIDLFEVERKGEKERFWPFGKLNNKALLWHGSRTTNFVGILSEGLKIAPPDAPATGYMFGKGLYFADVPSKSANYCHATRENPEGILLLCEVALGDMSRVYRAKAFKRAPKYFHSVYGVGKKKPNIEGRVYLEEGLVFDAGEVKDNKELEQSDMGRIDSDLQYNEYIVYDVGQVRIRYCARVKFNFINL